ncbi:MAG: xanthine dehydrogenase family protein molybdopterin-binding subunit [Thermoanaerobaculia bacterium]|nr:xanthine dehydrogenase family protein molybdopterin-binding subunit [Thermoanaerobaculia bacterium]
MSFIGTSPPRPDGLDKASGKARYADDFAVEGLWFGATVRSPIAHGRIVSIGWRGGAPADVHLVTAADLPGPNGVQLIDASWPILAAEVVQHVGEPVALVAAPSRREAALAAAAVEVVYEELPAVLDLQTAEDESPLCELSFGRGDAEAILERAEIVVEGCYRTGHQEHIYIECQAMTAWWVEDGQAGSSVEIAGSMQCPYYVHKSVQHAFGLEADAVRIRATVVGGGFGGKEDFPSVIAIHAALLARAAGHPVRIVYDRHEDIIGTTKRHPAVMRYRSAVDSDGTLQALEVDVTMDGGAYLTLSTVVLSRALLHAAGPYRCDHVRVRGRVQRTNTAPNGAFRGFGAPQVAFGVERHLDAIGRRVGVDPLTLRRRNAYVPGDRMPTGQVLDETTSALACLDSVDRRTDFVRRWHQLRERQNDDGTRRGLGLSLYFHGAGFTGNGERRMKSPATARLDAAGRIQVLSAMTDMGQGSVIVFRQIAAESGGVTFEDLAFPEPDTRDVPNSGPTVASRTTMIVGELVSRSVQGVSRTLAGWWGEKHPEAAPVRISGGRVRGGDGSDHAFRDVAQAYLREVGPLSVTVEHEPPPGPAFDESTYQGPAYPTYAWGADVAEVKVDPDTLAVKPISVTVASEVGRAIHPRLCIGQIEGGTLQAVGWALWEEIKMDRGRYLNDRLATYIIPTAKDAPDLDVELLEAAYPGGPFGAKGIGELPMDGGAPAIVAAIENATGLVLDEIPATPELLVSAEIEASVTSKGERS